MSKYKLGSIEFANWAQVNLFASALLQKGRRTLTGSELAFARDLLEYHVIAEQKKEKGVKGIKVGDPEFGTHLCFVIVHDDDTLEDFSYKRCRGKKLQNFDKVMSGIERQEKLSAYRQCVGYQTLNYRLKQLEDQKELQCIVCFSDKYLHVDHVEPSFISIVESFEKEHGLLNLPPIERCYSFGNTFKFKPSNETHDLFIKLFRKHHKDRAQYQILCRSCNAKKGSKNKNLLKAA